MKKIILMLFILVFPLNVTATFDVTNPLCTDSIKESLRKSINNIVYTKDKNITNNIVSYNIKITEIPNDVYIEYNNNKYNENDSVINNILPGAIVSLSLYTNDNNVCGGYKIYTKLIQVPYYNKYKDNELCNGNEEFIMCKEDVNLNITESEFKIAINEYIASKGKNTIIDIEERIENKDTFIDNVMNFLINYYIYILISIIILGSSGIVLILVKKRRNSF